MNPLVKELKDIVSDNCITILLNTHRTRPDNEKDALTLKNLIKEAEERLQNIAGKPETLMLVERLKELAASIDHNQNQESLVLFVNEQVAKYTRLAIRVEQRVIVDHSFATRDLVRAYHLESNYFVLVLSQQRVRLLEALNDKLVAEVKQGFPIEKEKFYPSGKADLSTASKRRLHIAEFFNRVDKEVNKVRKELPLPVLICTEEGNYHEYLKVADQKQSIYDTYLNKNRLEEKASAIVREAWGIVKDFVSAQNEERKSELHKAVDQNKFLSDTNEIWQAIKQGRVQTLFVEENRFQPAVVVDDIISYMPADFKDHIAVIDDIYDELIEENMNFGGDVVFLPGGELEEFNGFGAVTRY